MNIALVHEWLTNVAGSERVLLVLAEIFRDAPIYTSVFDEEKAKSFTPYKVHTSFLQSIPLMKSKRELLIPFTPLAFEQFDLSKYDLVISNTTMAAKGVITKPCTVHIAYCHTPPRYLWDPSVDPRAKQGAFQLLRASTVHKMRIWDRLAADRVDHYIANSNYIANRVKKYYKRDAIVVYPPVDVNKFKLDLAVKRGDHFLFVSRLISYKKCDLVIEAFNQLGLELRVVGSGPDGERLRSHAGPNIKFLGQVDDDSLEREYQSAQALIFPAEEDFGIVPVEAAACGTPAIAYRVGGSAETIIDHETGILFEDQSVSGLIEAIKQFQTLKFDPKAIRIQAEKFSIDNFKEKFIGAVEGLLKKS